MGDGPFTQKGLFADTDIRVTYSDAKQSRSENAVAINPTDPTNLVAASKKFIEPAKYWFTVAPVYSKNDGGTWTESTLPKEAGWDGFTDPALAFDHLGRAFLLVEPLHFEPDDITVLGMRIFRSTDGGVSWEPSKNLIEGRAKDNNDDKGWVAVDRGTNAATKGRIYAAWGVGGYLRVARSLDGGQTWKGAGALASGANVPGTSGAYAPEVTVGDDGTVHVAWHSFGTSTIQYTRSTDGGETFEPVQTIATGVAPLENITPKVGSWAEFPNGKFRILTLATGTVLPKGGFLVAWSDMREGHARIYYRTTPDGGANWSGPQNGQPLLPWLASSADVQHFHPQGATASNGTVAVAFYEFGPKAGTYRIDTVVVGSFTDGATFDYLSTITDAPWDPAVNAPPAHGNPEDAFIGEYFGFDADDASFASVWTDTRTGVQELFYDRVATRRKNFPQEFEGISGQIFGGVAHGGGGWIFVGGKFHKVPPRGPLLALLQAVATFDDANAIEHPSARLLQEQAARTIESIAKDLVPATLTSTVAVKARTVRAPTNGRQRRGVQRAARN